MGEHRTGESELMEECRVTSKLYYEAMEQLNCRDTDIDERDARIKELEEAVRMLGIDPTRLSEWMKASEAGRIKLTPQPKATAGQDAK